MIHESEFALSVEPVVFSDPKERQAMVDSLLHEIEQTLRDREPREKSWRVAIHQYHGALKRKHVDGAGDAELDIPSTREYGEMILSRLVNPICQRDRIFVGTATRPAFKEESVAFEDFLDTKIEHGEFRRFLEQFIRQGLIFSKAVVRCGPPKIQTTTIGDYYTTNVTQDGTVEKHWGAKAGSKLSVAPRVVSKDARVSFEVIPCVDFIHPMPCADPDTATWIAVRTYPTKDEIARDMHRGVYLSTDDNGKPLIDQLSKLNSQDRQDRAANSVQMRGVEQTVVESEPDEYELLDIYTTLNEREVVITVERKSRTCLRFVYNWLNEYPRGIRTWSFEEALNDIDGFSFAWLVEPYHRALSAIACQRLDEASRSLSDLIFVSDTLMDATHYFKDGKLRGGVFTVQSVQDIQKQILQFKLGGGFQQVESLETQIRTSMQRIAGLDPYNFGEEQIQRPTASGQMALIEEGKQPLYNRIESLRRVLRDLGSMVVARYRQYYPTGLEFFSQSVDPETDQLVRQVLTWPADYWQSHVEIDLAVNTQSLSREMRKQEKNAMLDRAPAIIGQILQSAQVAFQPNPVSPLAMQLLVWHVQNIVIPWAKEFDVPGIEQLKGIAGAIQQGSTVAQLLQSVQQLEQQVQQLTGGMEQISKAYLAATGHLPPELQPGAVGPPSQAAPVEGGAGSAGAPPAGMYT